MADLLDGNDLLGPNLEISQQAPIQTPISLREIQSICRKEQLVTFSGDTPLNKAVEILGSGIHRILLTDANSEVVGILNQLRILEFFWNEAVSFPMIDRLYGSLLRDLHQSFLWLHPIQA